MEHYPCPLRKKITSGLTRWQGREERASLPDLQRENKLHSFHLLMLKPNSATMILKLKIGRCLGDVKFLLHNNSSALYYLKTITINILNCPLFKILVPNVYKYNLEHNLAGLGSKMKHTNNIYHTILVQVLCYMPSKKSTPI